MRKKVIALLVVVLLGVAALAYAAQREQFSIGELTVDKIVSAFTCTKAVTCSSTVTVQGVASLGKTGSMAAGAPVMVNRSGIFMYNKNGVRYRLYVNMTGTETSSVLAVKK